MSATVPKCLRCATTHALYVKAHRQLQVDGRKIIELEAEVGKLKAQIEASGKTTEADHAG